MEAITSISQGTQVPPAVSDVDIVRAWTDARYRRSLSIQQLASLPDNPAGPVTLTDLELKAASGLNEDEDAVITTAFGCTEFTFAHWKACGC